jgi:hypothetical protein
VCLYALRPFPFFAPRDGILGHQFNKRLDNFAPLPSTGGFQRKPYSTLSTLVLITKKSAKQENWNLFMNGILWNGKMRVEYQTKTQVRGDSSLCPESSSKNAVQEFHLWSLYFSFVI